jgi:hypothetical protein
MTKWQLFECMTCKGSQLVSVIDSSNRKHTGIITSIQREDGSGSSFNVTMLEQGKYMSVTFHVRTID